MWWKFKKEKYNEEVFKEPEQTKAQRDLEFLQDHVGIGTEFTYLGHQMIVTSYACAYGSSKLEVDYFNASGQIIHHYFSAEYVKVLLEKGIIK